MATSHRQCSVCGGVLHSDGLCLRCALAGTTAEPAPARTFAGYELLDEIGQDGAMGSVYRAREPHSGRIVALKTLRIERMHSEEFIRRFRLEVETAANLDHPHLLPIHDVGESHGQLYYTMKLATGGSLARQLADNRWKIPLTDPKAALKAQRAIADLLKSAAEAVHHAHERGVLHRDLKPGNLLLDEDGTLYVSDFGLAKQLGSEVELTRTQGIVGTPAYMAPEQAEPKGRNVTARTDVWALGAILYEMLTGSIPFAGETPLQILDAVRTQEPRPPSTLHPLLHRDLVLICLKCLEKDPARRYATAADLAADLACFLGSKPISARAPTLAELLTRWWTRNPVVAPLLTGLLATLLLGIAATTWQAIAASRARDVADQKTREVEGLLEKQLEDSYVANVQMAGAYLELGELNRVRERLDACPEKFRSSSEWGLLNASQDESLRVFRGHSNQVSSASFSPDGRRIVTGSLDGTARVWDAESGTALVEVKRHASVRAVSFSPDGRRIVTGGSDGTARIWDAESGTALMVLKLTPKAGTASYHWSNRGVSSASFSPDGKRIVTGSCEDDLGRPDNTVRIWDAESGASLVELKGHSAKVRSAAFSPDGARVVTGSSDGTARIWDSRSGQSLAELKTKQQGVVNCAAFGPDGTRIVTASWDDKTSRVWDAQTGQVLLELKGHQGDVESAAFSPDGKRIVTASVDKTARIWDAGTGKLLAELKGHLSPVHGAAFSPDGQHVVTASEDRTARVWDTRWSESLSALWPDGQDLVRLKDYGTPGPLISHSLGRIRRLGSILDLRSSPDAFGSLTMDGQKVVTIQGERDFGRRGEPGVRVWDAQTGALQAELQTQESEFRDELSHYQFAAISPGGRHIVTVADRFRAREGQGTVRIWDGRSGRPLGTMEGHAEEVKSAAFNQDGQRVVTASADKTARVWSIPYGKPLLTLTGHSNTVAFAAFSPDGSRIATASSDATARIWDADSGRSLVKLTGHSGPVNSAVFSPDGRYVITTSDDRSARIWDVHSGQLQTVFTTPLGTIDSPAFSQDGRRVATISGGRAVIWDARSGKSLVEFKGSFQSVCFSQDQRRFLALLSDGSIQTWHCVPARDKATATDRFVGLVEAAIPDIHKRLADGQAFSDIRRSIAEETPTHDGLRSARLGALKVSEARIHELQANIERLVTEARWPEAIKAASESIELAPAHPQFWRQLVLLEAIHGDTNYLRHSGEMLRRFQEIQDEALALSLAQAALLLPQSDSKVRDDAARLVEGFVEKHRNRWGQESGKIWRIRTVANMLRSLRQERWDDVATEAKRILSMRLIGPALPSGVVMLHQGRDVPILAIASVAFHHQGRIQEARAALDRASSLLEEAEKEWASEGSMEWEIIVTLRVLVGEAIATQGTIQPGVAPPL